MNPFVCIFLLTRKRFHTLILYLLSGILPLDLQTIHQRIKDNVDVLTHFAEKREEGKERGLVSSKACPDIV